MSKNILCIESSSAICSVAVGGRSGLHWVESKVLQNHAESITGLIQECLTKAGMNIQELDAIAISEGPGSYTGLRIGTSTAKGICFASNLPLIAVSTLQAIANGVREHYSSFNGLIWPMIDARRMEVYHCVYDMDLNPLLEVKNGIVDEEGFKPGILKSPIVLCGDGAIKASPILGIDYYNIEAHAKYMYALAKEKFALRDFVPVEEFEPFYLKFANITKSSK